MLRRLALTVLMLAMPSVAGAQEGGVLAEYWASSGSLPPEYAWSVSVTIHADGRVILKRCKGYEKEGPACKTRKGRAEAAGLDAIRAAVAASGLVETPARQAEDIPVGGGSSGGAVYVEGAKVDLPAFPAEPDAPRVGAVLSAITAAIPDKLGRHLGGN
jgi:hypothetical protein